jgi:hypothetical protein
MLCSMLAAIRWELVVQAASAILAAIAAIAAWRAASASQNALEDQRRVTLKADLNLLHEIVIHLESLLSRGKVVEFESERKALGRYIWGLADRLPETRALYLAEMERGRSQLKSWCGRARLEIEGQLAAASRTPRQWWRRR